MDSMNVFKLSNGQSLKLNLCVDLLMSMAHLTVYLWRAKVALSSASLENSFSVARSWIEGG